MIRSQEFFVLKIFQKLGQSFFEQWNANYGIIVKTENRIQSNRVVSISKVIPINGPQIEREFFTLTLKIVNKL